MSSVGLIINERSNRSASVIDDLLYVARRFSSVRTEVLDGIKGLDRALVGMDRKHVDTLVLAGGDGTMQATFTDAINNRRFSKTPHFVALPCGMTNVIANDCGLRGEPAPSLENFLWRREKGSVKPLRRPLLSVTMGERAPIYGFFFGAGAFHGAVNYSRSKIQSKGVRRSLALTLSVLAYITKVALEKAASTEEIELEFLEGGAPGAPEEASLALFMATTLTKLGSGIYPFWGKGAGAMAATSIDSPARRLFRAAPAVLRSRSRPWFEDYGYRSWRSDQMVTRFSGPFVFDGEFFNAGERENVEFGTSHMADFLN